MGIYGRNWSCLPKCGPGEIYVNIYDCIRKRFSGIPIFCLITIIKSSNDIITFEKMYTVRGGLHMNILAQEAQGRQAVGKLPSREGKSFETKDMGLVYQV